MKFSDKFDLADADDSSSLQRVQLLLECLHDQLLASNNYCMKVCDPAMCAYFTESVVGWAQYMDFEMMDVCSESSVFKQPPTFTEFPTVSLLVYVSHTSPWHLVLTIIPTSPQYVVHLKQGTTLSIPIITSLCDEPWISSNLANTEPEPPIRKCSDARIKFSVSPLADLHTRTHDRGHPEQHQKVDTSWISSARVPLNYITAKGYEYSPCDVRDYSAYLEDRLFSRAFTNAVYRAVNEGVKIYREDVNAVIDLHSEQESLKIEDFNHCLGFLCSHFAEFCGKCGTFDDLIDDRNAFLQEIFSRHDKSCEAEHRAFKDSFKKIVHANFSSVPNLDDFFYYSNVTDQPIKLSSYSIRTTGQYALQSNVLKSTNKHKAASSIASSETASPPYTSMHVRPHNFDTEAPLFIKFECSIRISEEDVIVFPVSHIPSCLINLLDAYKKVHEVPNMDDLFEVNLYITAVTWPRLEYVFDSSTYPWLRDGKKFNSRLRKRCTFEEPTFASAVDYEEEPCAALYGLSALEKEALDVIRRKIYRLVEFETVLAMSRYGSPEREDLVKIASFIAEQEKLGEETVRFKTMKLNLLFVSNHERSFWRLRKRMETLNLDYCRLSQSPDPVYSSTAFPLYYYCCSVNNEELFRQKYLALLDRTKGKFCEKSGSSSLPLNAKLCRPVLSREVSLDNSESQNAKAASQAVSSTPVLQRASSVTAFPSPESMSEKKPASDSNRTDGCLDSAGDILTKCELYDFWLILTLDPFSATIHFCQRYKQLHEGLFSLMCESLKNEWRIINQKTLLEEMFDSKHCDTLLVPKDEDIPKVGRKGLETLIETRSFSSPLPSAWSKKVRDIYSQGGTVPLPSAKCTAGQFTCEIIGHHWFFVHPRLRESCVINGDDNLYSALELLKQEIVELKVENRSNMYVVKENDDLFYLRLHINPASVYESSAEPNISWMTKMSKDFETKILLTVHGYCKPGAKVESIIEGMQQALIQKTVKALKDAIRIGKELILFPEDVEYLQGNLSAPKQVYYFTLPKVMEKFLGTIFYYLCQQLSLYAVPVTNPVGFTSYCSDSSSPVPDGRSIFYAFNQKAGLGCVELRLVSPDGKLKSSLNYARFDKDAFSQLSPVWNLSQIGLRAFLGRLTYSRNTCSLLTQESAHDRHSAKDDFSSLVQFILWFPGGTEQNLVPIQSLCRLVVNQALCDLITEFGLFGKSILEFQSLPSPGPASIRCRDDRKSGDSANKRLSCENTFSIASNARASFSNVRTSLSTTRVSSASTRSQSSQSDISGKFMINPLIRRLSQNNLVYEPSAEESSLKQDKTSFIYVTAIFNTIAADWFDHFLAELKSKKEDQYSLKKHSFRMDSDYTARKASFFLFTRFILQVVERRLAGVLPSETVTVFVADPKGSKRLVSVDNTEELFNRVDLDTGRVLSNDRKITAGEQQEPRNTKMALMAYNQDFDEAILDYGADVCKNEENAKTVLEREKDNNIFRFQYCMQPFVPRRRLLYMLFSGDECDLYIYNYSAKKAEEVYKIVATAAFWLNGRSYLIREIGLDKMGISHLHQNFKIVMDPSLMNERKATASKPSGVSTGPAYEDAFLWLNAKVLTKFSFPDEEDPLFVKNFCTSCESPLEAQLRMKLYTYFQCPNPNLLMLKFYKEQCRQMVDLESDVDALLKTHNRFEKLYSTIMDGTPEMAENDFTDFIERSREVFFERAPLLFYPKWRPCIASIRISTKGTVELPGTPKSADLARVSQQTFSSSFSSFSSSKPPTPSSLRPNPPLQSKKSAPQKRYSSTFEPQSALLRDNPDPFVIKLEFMFVEEYVKYLEELGFLLLTVTNVCNRSKELNFYTIHYNAELDFSYDSQKFVVREMETNFGVSDLILELLRSIRGTKQSPNLWLCKAVQGGIIFINLAFFKPYFCVRVLLWNESQQGHSVVGRQHCTINSERQRNFEMEKDLTVALLHLQSYTYDFHLRMVAKYLVGGPEVLFSPGYDTHSLLVNLMYCFKSRPQRSRSGLLEGILKITGLPVDENMVWNYLLALNDKKRRVVALRTGSDPLDRYMIVSEKMKDFFSVPYKIVCMCVQDNSKEPENCLKLNCYVLLVSYTRTSPFVDLVTTRKRKRSSKKGEKSRFLRNRSTLKYCRKRFESSIASRKRASRDFSIDAIDYERVYALRRRAGNLCEGRIWANYVHQQHTIRIQNKPLYTHHVNAEVGNIEPTTTPEMPINEGQVVKQLSSSPKKLHVRKSPAVKKKSFLKRHSIFPKRFFSDSKQRSPDTEEPPHSPYTLCDATPSSLHPRLQKVVIHADDFAKSGLCAGNAIYVNHISSHGKALQKQLETHFNSFRKQLTSLVKEASWQCRRDSLWTNMFKPSSISPTNNAGQFFSSKIPDSKMLSQLMPELRQVYSCAVTTAEVDELLEYVSIVRLSDLDSNFESLSRDFLSEPFFRALIRNFGPENCRLVCSDLKKYLVIAAEGQSAFLFSAIGKSPIEMRLIHKDNTKSEISVEGALSRQLNDVLNVVASFCWMELTATPVIGKVR